MSIFCDCDGDDAGLVVLRIWERNKASRADTTVGDVPVYDAVFWYMVDESIVAHHGGQVRRRGGLKSHCEVDAVI